MDEARQLFWKRYSWRYMGKTHLLIERATIKAYGSYLKSYVNVVDGTKETFVQLEFVMDDNGTEEYCIRRSWSGKGRSSSEDIYVEKDGIYNEF